MIPKQPFDPRVAEIIRAGKIRVALFLPLYTRDPITDEIQAAGSEGIYLVEIARALAVGLGVDIQLLGYQTPVEAMAALKGGACDLSFFAVDPIRSEQVDFSPPLVQSDFTYLVPAGSSIRMVADVDQRGMRVAVVRNHNSTKTLGRFLGEAVLVYGETPESTVNLVRTGQAEAMASVRTSLLEYSTQLPGSRVLEDRYGELLLAMAVPKLQPGWLAYVAGFVEEAKASGLVQRALDCSGVRGTQVAVSTPQVNRTVE